MFHDIGEERQGAEMNVTEALRAGRRREVWERFCGFLDLELGDFLESGGHICPLFYR